MNPTTRHVYRSTTREPPVRCRMHGDSGAWPRRQPPVVRSNSGRVPAVALSAEQRHRLGLAVHDPHAQLIGARAKQSGRAFEQEIEEANAFYERHGLAVVYRHHPPVEGWGRTLRVTGRGPADFSGVVRLPGTGSVAVAFDCKVITDDASYRHGERDRHQLESLLRFRAAGGRAFLLLLCRALDRVWLLEDLDGLMRRERVPVRRRESDAVEHLLPVVEPSSLADVARGALPHWHYLSLLGRTS